MDKAHLQNQFNTLCNHLISLRNDRGYWTGYLSSSALATAVSIVAIRLDGADGSEQKVQRGLHWLYLNVNQDGGFGDTPESESNISTSLLCYAAISYCRQNGDRGSDILSGIEGYLNTRNINLKSGNLIKSILDFYGKDLTFSVPILSMLVICGVLGSEAVRMIPQLPFELSLFPNSVYRLFNLQVVSYAIPALIAVGIFSFDQKRGKNFLLRLIRRKSIKPSIRKLERIMPESGGFLEAIPLTAFSSMCLMSSNQEENIVVPKAIEFLNRQQRSDGGWPIDTDLSIWVTTLSIKAMDRKINSYLTEESVDLLRDHLLSRQYKSKHPFNDAPSGGWGWTNYSGSVPDADDTPGAIVALLDLYEGTIEENVAIINGCRWLTGIQNSDGGIPTFCKGWGRLPFDRSCADLTGHALLAWCKAMDILGDAIPSAFQNQFRKSIINAVAFLINEQDESGYWLPLWFGSQKTDNKTNPAYGTAKVGIYIHDCLPCKSLDSKVTTKLNKLLLKSVTYLSSQQNEDGSWGAIKGVPGTIEETSLAVSLLTYYDMQAALKGIEWLEQEYKNYGLRPNPIGLYFATLWYDEQLYPLTFYLEALRRNLEHNDFSNKIL